MLKVNLYCIYCKFNSFNNSDADVWLLIVLASSFMDFSPIDNNYLQLTILYDFTVCNTVRVNYFLHAFIQLRLSSVCMDHILQSIFAHFLRIDFLLMFQTSFIYLFMYFPYQGQDLGERGERGGTLFGFC